MSVHTDSPVVHSVRASCGIAGQRCVTARVQYPGEPVRSITFVGSIYGDRFPVTMVTPECPGGVYVDDACGRFGPFGEDWVRKFFA